MGWFSDLSQTRAAGMSGPSPISYAEIDAWARLTGRTLETWEVDVLRRLDVEYMRERNSRKAGGK